MIIKIIITGEKKKKESNTTSLLSSRNICALNSVGKTQKENNGKKIIERKRKKNCGNQFIGN